MLSYIVSHCLKCGHLILIIGDSRDGDQHVSSWRRSHRSQSGVARRQSVSLLGADVSCLVHVGGECQRGLHSAVQCRCPLPHSFMSLAWPLWTCKFVALCRHQVRYLKALLGAVGRERENERMRKNWLPCSLPVSSLHSKLN